jgi:hypothetical protein
MMKMGWTGGLATVALYSVGGAAAGYYSVGAEHDSSAAVEKTFITPDARGRGAARGAMAGGLFGVGLVGLFSAISSKGTARMLGGAGALVGFGGLLFSLNKFRTERTAEIRGAATAAPIPASTAVTNIADEASTPPTALTAETDAALNEALGPVEPVSDADLLAAGTTSGLGRLAALRARGRAPFHPRSWR